MNSKLIKTGIKGLLCLMTAQLFINFPVLAEEGGDAGGDSSIGASGSGGGDGVVLNGELIMREFLKQGNVISVANNAKFVKSIEGFEPLLKELTQVCPSLGLAIFEQLRNVRFWEAETSLPKLPNSVTTLYGQTAEVQIAIRTKDDIFISMPMLRKLKDDQAAYLILHELLHGIISGKDALHHASVRSVVKYIHDNRGHLNREKLFAYVKLNSGLLDGHVFDSNKYEGLIYLSAFGSNEDPLRCMMEGAIVGIGELYRLSGSSLFSWKSWREEPDRCDNRKNFYVNVYKPFMRDVGASSLIDVKEWYEKELHKFNNEYAKYVKDTYWSHPLVKRSDFYTQSFSDSAKGKKVVEIKTQLELLSKSKEEIENISAGLSGIKKVLVDYILNETVSDRDGLRYNKIDFEINSIERELKDMLGWLEHR